MATGAPRHPIVTSVNTTTRPWTDVNGDYLPQWTPGCTYPSAGCELGPLANNNFGGANPAAAVYDPALSVGWGVCPGNWEVTAGVQHELLPKLGVEFTYFRRSYFDFYATQNQAYSPSGRSCTRPTTPSSAMAARPSTVWISRRPRA